MGSQDHVFAEEPPGRLGGLPGFDVLREAMVQADEPERYRLLAELFHEFALVCRDGANRPGSMTEQLAVLGRKVQELEKRRTDLEDQLRTCQADLSLREKQLEAEQARGQELQAVNSNQRARLESAEEEIRKLEAELVNRGQDLHRAEIEREKLQIKLQRAELASGDTSRVEALETDKRQLTEQVRTLEAGMERLRADKNTEIESISTELAQVRDRSSESAEALLASLWQRLASVRPPLVTEGHVQPTVQAAERLVDAFIEMASFVHKLDQDMRPSLDGFAKPDAKLWRSWSVYKEQCDLFQTLRLTLAPVQGKHVGALKMQLKVCRNWVFAALVSCDSTIEWIADELRTHLLGPSGAGSNPKCTLKEYVRMSGPEAFLEHMQQLRSQKLAEVYARGA